MAQVNSKDFLDKGNVFAVVGVSRNPNKYGFKVFMDLINSGYNVYGINPHANYIKGIKIYTCLKELPVKPDVVVSVVPPSVTEKIVQEIKELGIKKIWMQPGSESEKAVNFCRKNDIDAVVNTCIMVNNLRVR